MICVGHLIGRSLARRLGAKAPVSLAFDQELPKCDSTYELLT
jgi:hypothetical protein